MKHTLFTLLFLFTSSFGFSQRDTDHIVLENFFKQNSAIEFKSVEAQRENTCQYELMIEQPLDHADKSKGYFKQKIILEHLSFDKPTIIHTNGYTLSPGPRELLELVDANVINVEHRFFGDSKPDSLNWKYLDLKQSSDDLHTVTSTFKQLYKGKWISSGISKGGTTSIFYEYFYPEDADITIPYVAPVNFSNKDKRIYDFLANVGDETCRKKLYDAQINMLKNREEILDDLYWYAKGQKSTFNYLNNDLELVFEYTVLEYPFSFWQMGYECDEIPDKKADVDDLTEHLLKVIDINFYNDESIDFFAPLYYQGATQMGYYGFLTEPYKPHLKKLSGEPSAAFVPMGTEDYTYSNALNEHVHKWLQGQASHIMFIYGEYDTWSATAADIGMNNKVKKFIVPKEDHRDARYANMDEQMKKEFRTLLNKWLKED